MEPRSELHPPPDNLLLVRTYQSDDTAWEELLAQLRAAPDPDLSEFDPADPEIVDGPPYAGLSPTEIGHLIIESAGEDGTMHAFVADERAHKEPDHPIVLVSTEGSYGHGAIPRIETVRFLPEFAFVLIPNLVTGNVTFAEFARVAGDDGVIRSFLGE